ncbi:hypothetical protein LTR36_004533 [Oleoguttula mirabilis]|uniref:Diaminohydroxyphosphoribosylamino-pyrimidine deaminase n=1 Tax=Oleoguttula mirabilis TaxID=1507867 RepID=A0AAV9JFR5_9PEZI|nr:hypothetical protein LTR36_004533 [Oleoguttula mirabilis]
MEALLTALGDEVQDVDEETFHLFSQAAALPDLGMIDPTIDSLELSIAGRDFTITQSPGALQSTRKEGTTGAAVWQTSVRVAEWLASPNNVLFATGLLDESSTVLELGSGISGLVPCVLAAKVGAVVATDQQHVLKTMRDNITANVLHPASRSPKHTRRKPNRSREQPASNINVVALDWEEDDIEKVLVAQGFTEGVDVIVACDCIYNYALLKPLMQTCVDICTLRRQQQQQQGRDDRMDQRPTVCVMAQQLRQADVFEEWLQTAMRWFRVWRVPDVELTGVLRSGSGFAVHICVSRSADGSG